MRILIWLEKRLYLYADNWLEFVDGLIGILTLGFVRLSLSYKFCLWHSIRECKEKFNS